MILRSNPLYLWVFSLDWSIRSNIVVQLKMTRSWNPIRSVLACLLDHTCGFAQAADSVKHPVAEITKKKPLRRA
jgi:hypothetical protein